jgi:ElaB/YqjD/DUF883 family membrane-anchored ribosome-binding protein
MPASVFEKTAMVEDALREASKIKAVLTDAVKDGTRAANQQIRRGCHAAEDVLEEAKHTVKRRPIEAVAVVFAAGFVVGSLLAYFAMPRR